MKERLEPIWAALSDAYGSSFVNQFGDEPSSMWIGGLSAYNEEQIRGGIVGLINSGSPYAPNLPTVIGAIEESSGWRHARQSKPCHEVLAAPIVDRGEGALMIDAPVDKEKTPADYCREMKELF